MDREDRAKKVMFQRVVLGIFAVLVVIAIVVGIRSCAKKDDNAKVTTVKATKAPTTKETTTNCLTEVSAQSPTGSRALLSRQARGWVQPGRTL